MRLDRQKRHRSEERFVVFTGTVIHPAATLWMFMNTLNGSYDVMGLTGRLRGVGLNKLMVSLHGK